MCMDYTYGVYARRMRPCTQELDLVPYAETACIQFTSIFYDILYEGHIQGLCDMYVSGAFCIGLVCKLHGCPGGLCILSVCYTV